MSYAIINGSRSGIDDYRGIRVIEVISATKRRRANDRKPAEKVLCRRIASTLDGRQHKSDHTIIEYICNFVTINIFKNTYWFILLYIDNFFVGLSALRGVIGNEYLTGTLAVR